MGRGKHCTPEVRNLIRQLIAKGKTYKEVQDIFQCSAKMVTNALKYEEKAENRGRKSLMSPSLIKRMISHRRKNPSVTSKQIKEQFHVSASAATIRRRLREHNLTHVRTKSLKAGGGSQKIQNQDPETPQNNKSELISTTTSENRVAKPLPKENEMIVDVDPTVMVGSVATETSIPGVGLTSTRAVSAASDTVAIATLLAPTSNCIDPSEQRMESALKHKKRKRGKRY